MFEYRKLQPNGKSTYNSDHAYVIRNGGGSPIRVVGRSADVTEAKRVAHASGTEQRFRALFEQNPLAILVANEGLRVTSANPAASDVLGYAASELKRCVWKNSSSPEGASCNGGSPGHAGQSSLFDCVSGAVFAG